MKKIITLILVLGWVLTSYSQKVIQLEETKLNFEPTAKIVFEDYENGIIKVKENYATQFQADAIAFIKENFDIVQYLNYQNVAPEEIIIVTATSSKGRLIATYDGRGNIIKTYQKFNDIALPYDVRNEVFANHIDWTMTKNRYVATGELDQIDNQKYIITLERGKERKNLKITPASISNKGVAYVEKY
ncbi:MAG: hypothetical protein WB492_10205 [Christiangramia sp.]